MKQQTTKKECCPKCFHEEFCTVSAKNRIYCKDADCPCHNSSPAGWEDKLQHWIETQHGTAGWEMKLENFVRELLAQRDAELVERVPKVFKKSLFSQINSSGGIGGHIHLEEMIDAALDEVLKLI